jgi:hypothetical protein
MMEMETIKTHSEKIVGDLQAVEHVHSAILDSFQQPLEHFVRIAYSDERSVAGVHLKIMENETHIKPRK